jgi:hypothetical protein
MYLYTNFSELLRICVSMGGADSEKLVYKYIYCISIKGGCSFLKQNLKKYILKTKYKKISNWNKMAGADSRKLVYKYIYHIMIYCICIESTFWKNMCLRAHGWPQSAEVLSLTDTHTHTPTHTHTHKNTITYIRTHKHHTHAIHTWYK